MFVNIIYFPKLKEGKRNEFIEWFKWSTDEFKKHEGFIRRRLLQPIDGGNYAAIVEHESYDSFMAMHTSPTQANALERLKPLLDGSPTPRFFETAYSSISSDYGGKNE